MSKQKFFIDMDMTIVDSVQAFCSAYNIIYRQHPKFKPADYTKVKKYNFSCECPLVKKPLDIFAHELFFNNLKFINHNTYEVLQQLNEKYQPIIVTIGTPMNLSRKALWIENRLQFIKDMILIANDGCKMDKSIVDMSGGIFIDDIPSNLESSNAETKFLFGQIYSWNNDWQGEYCRTYDDIAKRFL